jgi:hypothetical protein
MAKVERRRSVRFQVFQEEAAVVNAGGLELLVKIVDLSKSGALIRVLDLPALGSCDFDIERRMELSLHHKDSVFHLMARVVRTGPLFVALEFIDNKPEVLIKLEQKLSLVQSRNREIGKASGVIGSA